ncbi:hypothetical protein M404DRAFT_395868 [Pisolithus tinctorius Marx 270]|uniref:Uncharacterized protein n=1 Tax=Pisolithus tinctorius Marx 270 TaxID=870435 RepID=A0A0C3KDT9_PISTI|nr:hypothetical protein M404DRAFT_395868 [Pisolithus tinctorius Marx 270]
MARHIRCTCTAGQVDPPGSACDKRAMYLCMAVSRRCALSFCMCRFMCWDCLAPLTRRTGHPASAVASHPLPAPAFLVMLEESPISTTAGRVPVLDNLLRRFAHARKLCERCSMDWGGRYPRSLLSQRHVR